MSYGQPPAPSPPINQHANRVTTESKVVFDVFSMIWIFRKKTMKWKHFPWERQAIFIQYFAAPSVNTQQANLKLRSHVPFYPTWRRLLLVHMWPELKQVNSLFLAPEKELIRVKKVSNPEVGNQSLDWQQPTADWHVVILGLAKAPPPHSATTWRRPSPA
jgi:hypothetical protein